MQNSSALIEPQKLAKTLLMVVGVLIVLHVLSVAFESKSWQLHRMFYLDRECNIPTWFSSFLLGLTALAAYGCSKSSLAKQQKRSWFIIAIGFIFLSCDEVATLHESMGDMVGRRFVSHFFGPQYVHNMEAWWSVVLGPLVLAGLIILWFLLCKCFQVSKAGFRYVLAGFILSFLHCLRNDISLLQYAKHCLAESNRNRI